MFHVKQMNFIVKILLNSNFNSDLFIKSTQVSISVHIANMLNQFFLILEKIAFII